MKSRKRYILKGGPGHEKKVYRRVRIGIVSVLSLYVIYVVLVLLLFSGCYKEPCYTCLAFSDGGNILRDTDYLCGESAKDSYYHTWEWESGFADVTVECYKE